MALTTPLQKCGVVKFKMAMLGCGLVNYRGWSWIGVKRVKRPGPYLLPLTSHEATSQYREALPKTPKPTDEKAFEEVA